MNEHTKMSKIEYIKFLRSITEPVMGLVDAKLTVEKWAAYWVSRGYPDFTYTDAPAWAVMHLAKFAHKISSGDWAFRGETIYHTAPVRMEDIADL